MGAISSLSTAGGVLRRNPIIFLVTLVFTLLGSLPTVWLVTSGGTTSGLYLLGVLLLYLLVPFFAGGILGMAEEGCSETTGLGTFFDSGTENYLSILGGGILFAVIFAVVYIAYIIVAVIIIVIGSLTLLSASQGGGAGVLGLGFGLVSTLLILLVIPLVFLLYLFLYFFDVAIVIDDERAWGSIKRSVGFVRNNFASAFGYAVITGVLLLIAYIPMLWLFLSTGTLLHPTETATGGVSLGSILPLLVVYVVLFTVYSAFMYAYKAALYAGLTGGSSTEATD